MTLVLRAKFHGARCEIMQLWLGLSFELWGFPISILATFKAQICLLCIHLPAMFISYADTYSGCFGSLLANWSETTGLRLLVISYSYMTDILLVSDSHLHCSSRDLVPSVVAAVFPHSSLVLLPWPWRPAVHMMSSPLCWCSHSCGGNWSSHLRQDVAWQLQKNL